VFSSPGSARPGSIAMEIEYGSHVTGVEVMSAVMKLLRL
jgi:hypothetical protein